MLAYQPPQRLVFIFIAICITQFALIQADEIKCIKGFTRDKDNSDCRDSKAVVWTCPTNQCGRDHHLWVPMKGCFMDGVPGTSSQECTGYNYGREGRYQCWTSGVDKSYFCPYTTSNVPFITCSGCSIQPPQGNVPSGNADSS
ncbi:uncharacterized protein MELLADRAFT_123813 [Melampsora larici-populina 98AG31]|uniref:Secreted protein n=1 Tax=Melampsora larici-populina (strain 98AG31 / pathotype 3-4-7) TaxID=747676 RepID=F4RY56_MELLP|nr:uncharacterized protein MELLADRAFT_123813 [Melampsora larici-populina 98AG31]EGG02622.1 secreted protein [Melampsora larici-populina 98AG31]